MGGYPHNKGETAVRQSRSRERWLTDGAAKTLFRPLVSNGLPLAVRDTSARRATSRQVVFGMLVRANRSDVFASILSKGLRKTIADIGVAGAGKFIEPDRAQKTRLERVAPTALHEQHAAAGVRRRHWKKSRPSAAQALEPSRQRVSRPGAGHDDIAFAQRSVRPVAVEDRDLRPGARASRALAPPVGSSISIAKTFPSARRAPPGSAV